MSCPYPNPNSVAEIYSFPDYELPDARRDQLAVGVVTSQRSAVLLRVVSGTSSDFIEMELVSMHAAAGPPSNQLLVDVV